MNEPETSGLSMPATERETAEVALAHLVPELDRVLVAYLTIRLRSEADAREVAQEAYARLLRTRQDATRAHWRHTVFTTATHLATDRLRHRGVHSRAAHLLDAAAEVSATAPPDPADLVSQHEQAGRLRAVLAELPEPYRQAFHLQRVEGLSQDEVAQRLQVSTRMVRRYVTYVMVYCRLRLDGKGIEEIEAEVKV